jgi:hypothetical protein
VLAATTHTVDGFRVKCHRIILVTTGDLSLHSYRLAPSPRIGSFGVNGESVPNEIENPIFLLEVIHTAEVPALMQKN